MMDLHQITHERWYAIEKKEKKFFFHTASSISILFKHVSYSEVMDSYFDVK